MRRQLLRILVFLVSLACITSNGLSVAFAAPQGDYVYTVYGDQVTITGYNGPGGAIAIPATLEGYPVTAIYPTAFSGKSAIHSIVLPQSLAAIGANAFTGCASLSAVYFRGDAPVLGNRAFSECADGFTVYYPSNTNGWSQSWYGYSAQAYDASATHDVTYDGNGATAGSAPIDALSYTTGDPVSVMGIGSLAKGSDVFTGWNTKADGTGIAYAAGSSFAITEDVTVYARWNRVLTRGTPTTYTVGGITWSYTPLGQEFAEINGSNPVPADLVIPSAIQGRTVISVGNDAFKASSGLQTVTLPSTVETIGRMAFRSCPNLKSVTLHEGLAEIEPYAFYLCENLVSMKFPSSLIRLGDGAFQWDSRLTAAVFAGDAPAMDTLTFDRCSRDFQIYRANTAHGWTNPYNARTVQIYQPGEAYSITYDNNGGTATVPAAVVNIQMGDVFVAADQEGMHNGYYSFKGWNTKADGTGTSYEAGQRVAATGNTTLYAVWFMDYREANNQNHVVIDGATWWYLPIGEFFCTVYDREGASGFVTIPNFIDGRMVIGVYQNAFGYNTKITGVSIPPNVTTVTKYALQYCANLSTVVFRGDAPTEVGYQMMRYCDDDLTVYYPASASGWSNPWNGFPAQPYDDTASYTVIYDGNGTPNGSAPTDSAAYPAFTEAPVLAKGSLVKGGYSFGGWNTQANGSGTEYQPGDPLLVTENVRLYAQWYLGDCSISYDRQDGSTVTRLQVNSGTALPAPANPERYGYTFGGWYTSPTPSPSTAAVAFPYMVTGHVTLYAKWTLNRYTVTYDCQGGSDIDAIMVIHGGDINAPAQPTKSGYIFAGWYLTEDCRSIAISFPYVVTDDITLYAKWTQDPTPTDSPAACAIRFDNQDGSAVTSQVVEEGTLLDAPDDPVREGYTFGGWYETAACDTDAVSFPYEVSGDATLYALWTIDSYTVSFDSQGGSDIEDITVVYGERIIAPIPVLTGYNFTGWYLDTDCTQRWDFAQDTVSEDMMLYAGWEAQPRNSYLSGVKLSAGSLSRAFTPKTTAYTVNLSEDSGAVTITPIKAYDGATMTIDGKRVNAKTVTLANGKSAVVTVKVTWNKKTTAYKLTIQRPKSTNNLLSALSATAGSWSAAFNPAVTTYTLALPQNVAKVTIKGARASALATVSPASKAYTLKPGQTVKATIKVKSQYGVARTYTITITRAKAALIK